MPDQLFVGGKWSDGHADTAIEVTSPATGAVLGSIPTAAPADVDAAVAAARAAAPLLERMTPFERAGLCENLAALIERDKHDLARSLTLEQGKPLAEEALPEIEEAAENFALAAEEGRRLETAVLPSAEPSKKVFTFRKPVGVYAIVSPWNFPAAIPAELIGPAVAGGNPCILKPSEYTPLIAARLVELAEEAGWPPGVISLLPGGGDVGRALVGHGGVDGIGFVGSADTAEAIVRAAGLKRTLLEASGNGPQIVLDDAEVAAAAAAAVYGARFVSGQCCVATERVLCQRGVHDEFVSHVLAEADAIALGDPLDAATTMGPLNNAAVAAKMDRHLADAAERGVELLRAGGRSSGFPTELYYSMAVADGVGTDTLLFREESFGPVVPITVFDTDDEAVALANDTDLGLQAAVFTSSLSRAFRFVDEVRAGTVVVNDSTASWETHPPFGGAAGTRTGWGRIGGKYTLMDMTDLRTAVVDTSRTRDSV